MAGNYALEINNLSVSFKVYEGKLDIISDLSLYVKQGERVGIIGEAGCGKTTVLKATTSVLRMPPAIIKKDDILVCGTSINGRKGIKNQRKNISMIFQDPSTSLNPTLKIKTQMKDILKSQFPKYSKSKYENMMLEALRMVSMPAPERVLGSYPIQLSGGMRQRVCIAMALMKDTSLIIADEPTTALDVTIEEQILDLLNNMVSEQKKSLILVSHALGAVKKITDRVYVMYAGNIIETGDTMDVFENPKHPYTIGLLAATPRLTGEGISDGIAGDIPSYLNPPKGCRFSDRCSFAKDICMQTSPQLKEDEDKPSHLCACHFPQGV